MAVRKLYVTVRRCTWQLGSRLYMTVRRLYVTVRRLYMAVRKLYVTASRFMKRIICSS